VKLLVLCAMLLGCDAGYDEYRDGGPADSGHVATCETAEEHLEELGCENILRMGPAWDTEWITFCSYWLHDVECIEAANDCAEALPCTAL
jgi:hypothetical protein